MQKTNLPDGGTGPEDKGARPFCVTGNYSLVFIQYVNNSLVENKNALNQVAPGGDIPHSREICEGKEFTG